MDPLIIMQCPSLSLVAIGILKSILSDLSIATPAFFWFSFAWNTFFYPFPFSLYVSPDLKQISGGQHPYRPCFCIHSASLCLLIGTFNPFTFNAIIDMSSYCHFTVLDLVLDFFFLLYFFSSLWWQSWCSVWVHFLFSFFGHTMWHVTLVPQPGIKTCSLWWKHEVLTPGPPGKSLFFLFWVYIYYRFLVCDYQEALV